jgi:hypothetical protein
LAGLFDLEHVARVRIEGTVSQRDFIMAKFYVQSGELEVVLQAHDGRCAAIWAVHRTLSQTLPFLCEEAGDMAELGELTRLGDWIVVSERGFDSNDAEVFDTLDVMTEWNQLLVALERLQSRCAEEVDTLGRVA